MWTPQNRKRYDRSRLRYPSDLTDEEWAHIAPLIPPAKPGGNKRMVDVREVMNGVMYVLSTGCQWRALPKDLPPKSTVHDYFIFWSCDGTLDRLDRRGLERWADDLAPEPHADDMERCWTTVALQQPFQGGISSVREFRFRH